MPRRIKNVMTISAIITVCAICLIAFVACEPSVSEYKVTYVYDNGQEDFVAQVKVGGTATEPKDPEKDGFVFVCWVRQGETEPYDFGKTLDGDITLVATWQAEQTQPDDTPSTTTVRVRWDAEESARFVYEGGSVSRNLKVGEKITFGVEVSPYYKGEPKVTVGGETLTPGADGKYSFVVSSAVTVRVSGLKRDDMQIKGAGTAKNPYIINNASQLKVFADSVNAGEDKYASSYIELGVDIDMNGFEFEPIGTLLYQFQGTFDGKNHTISDYEINATSGLVGFFGCIANGVVKNLKLATDMSAETVDSNNYIVGGVAAYCISGDIENCSYEGSIRVTNTLKPDSYVVYIGGICGFVQGYSTDYTGTVTYCVVNADISVDGQYNAYTTGGIAGATHGSSESTPAYIHNCVYNGEITGKSIISGGIAGYLRDRSSVTACFTSGRVHAQSADDYSAAGAIVGVADNETAVAYCLSTAKCDNIGAKHDYETSKLIGIIYADGTGDYNGTTFTYQSSGSGYTMSTIAQFTDNSFTVNANGNLSVTLDDGDYPYSATFVKQ